VFKSVALLQTIHDKLRRGANRQEREGKLQTSTQSQTFAMIVTAEPYSAVSLPREIVALRKLTLEEHQGKIYPNNSYRLMKRGEYEKLGNSSGMTD